MAVVYRTIDNWMHLSAKSPFKSGSSRWLLFAGLLAVLTTSTFGSLADLNLETHDRENLLDSALISEDFTYLLSTAKHHTSGRPLYELIIWLEYVLWGEDMRYFHLVGAFWHGTAALLLVALCRRLGWPWGMSGASGLLFLFNVSHFRAVHWVSAQCYIASFMILCGGLLVYLAWVEERRVWGQVAFYAALLSGLLVHTATIVLVPLTAALAWSRQRPLTAALKQLALPAAVGAAGVLAIKAYYANSPQMGQLSSGFELWGHMQSLLYMISRLVSTAHALPFAVYESAEWEPALGGLVVLACMLLACRRDGRLDFWGIWILTAPLPFLVLDPDHLKALMPGPSRYLYTTSAGIAVLGGAALYRLSLLPRIGMAAYLLLVPIVAISHIQLKRAEGVSHYFAARHRMVTADWPTAVDHMAQAINRGGDLLPLEDAYNRLFVSMLAAGEPVGDRLAEARARLPSSRSLAVLADVLSVEDDDPQVREAALRRIDRRIDEERWVRLEFGELDLSIMSVVFFRNRGIGLVTKGEYKRAIQSLYYALQFDPEHKGALTGWAFAHYQLGRYEQAARAWSQVGDGEWTARSWQKAVEKAPEDATARLEWARSLARNGALQGAAEQYHILLQAEEGAVVVFELGVLYLIMGEGTAAKALFVQGIEAYGAPEVEKLGALAQLRELAAEKSSPTAVEILRAYWPEE